MSFHEVNNKNLWSVFYKQSIVLGPQEWKIKKKKKNPKSSIIPLLQKATN